MDKEQMAQEHYARWENDEESRIDKLEDAITEALYWLKGPELDIQRAISYLDEALSIKAGSL